MSTVVVNTWTIPSLADAGLWGAVSSFFANFWPAFVICLALILFAGFGPALIGLVKKGADAVKSL